MDILAELFHQARFVRILYEAHYIVYPNFLHNVYPVISNGILA